MKIQGLNSLEIDYLQKKFKAIQIQINKTEEWTHYFSANYKFSDSLIQIPIFLLKGYIVYSSKNCSE